jgi:hypothetical protein
LFNKSGRAIRFFPLTRLKAGPNGETSIRATAAFPRLKIALLNFTSPIYAEK